MTRGRIPRWGSARPRILGAVQRSIEQETKEAKPTERRRSEPLPALVITFTDGKPASRLVVVGPKPTVFGRGGAGVHIPLAHDEELSRRHLAVSFDGSAWRIADLGSRNGTFVDGERIEGEVVVDNPRVIRIGLTDICVERDASRLSTATVTATGNQILGPGVQPELHRVAAAAARGDTVLVYGESGVGKDLVARWFHAKSAKSRGKFVHVNGAAITKSTAAAELFGAKKGAYSGADADRAGLIGGADGGVFFLDEVALLDLDLQGALLTAIETKEIYAVGSSTPRKVDVLFCFATNVDLDAAVERGAFRGDLLMRIAQTAVRIPPLRERREEIAYLVEVALKTYAAKTGKVLTATAQFVEACLLRPWRVGNIRELNNALTAACDSAVKAKSTELTPDDLPPPPKSADNNPPSVVGSETTPQSAPLAAPKIPDVVEPPRDLKRAAFFKAYYELNGDVAAAAKRAGISRSSGYVYLAERRAEDGTSNDDE